VPPPAWTAYWNSRKQDIHHQTCQVLKNFMREGNFLRLVSTRRHLSWRALGEILKFEFPRSPENCLSEVFFRLFQSTNLMCSCYKNMKFYSSLLLPKRQKIALLWGSEYPSFLSLFDMRLRHTFSRLVKTSAWVLTLAKRMHWTLHVQMKRNGSNCPTGRNLDKLSLLV
jgi:hypothetical protein